MKITLSNMTRICVLAMITSMGFLTTGCFCWICLPQDGRNSKMQTEKGQEVLAKKENPNGTKTGMITEFTEAKVSVKQAAVPQASAAPYKDLSMLLVADDEKSCPFNTESAHTQFSAGPNINFKSAGDDVYANGSHKPGLGFQAGMRSTFRFSEKFSVVPGIFFKQNNASEEATITDGEPPVPGEPGYSVKIEDRYSYSYLSAPILAQYNLTRSLSVNAGPEVNYLLKSKVKSTTSFGDDDQKSEEDLTKNSVKLGLGLQVGLRYQIPDSRIGFQLTYDHRLSRLNEKTRDGYGPTEVPAWRMKSVQLGVTVRTCDLFKSKFNHDNVTD